MRLRVAFLSAGVAFGLGLLLRPILRPWLAEHWGDGLETVRMVDGGRSLPEIFRLRDNDRIPEGGEEPAQLGELVRRRLPPVWAEVFFPALGESQVHHPQMISRRKGSGRRQLRFADHPQGRYPMVTNALGMREDEEPAKSAPDRRVIVVGDSHVDGVCANRDSFPNALERLLAQRHSDRSIEVLNAGTGGWSFYNYLGALEAYRELEPDLFVVTVYGGNDFYGAMPLHRYHRGKAFLRSDRSVMERLQGFEGEERGFLAQWATQVAYFASHPKEEALALEMSAAIASALVELAREAEVELLALYLPPVADAQPKLFGPALERVRAKLELSPRELAVSRRLASGWAERWRAAGIEVLDLQSALEAVAEPLYWPSDHHLNLAGHRRVAQTILPAVEGLLGLGD